MGRKGDPEGVDQRGSEKEMTVICYDRKLKRMASDSLCSDMGFYKTNSVKLYRTSAGAIIGTSGNAECRNMMALFDKVANSDELPSMNEMMATKNEVVWLLALPDNSIFEVYCLYDEFRHDEDCWLAGIVELADRWSATGHGMDYALAALEAGATPEQAVKVACKYSLFCRLPVQSMALDEDGPTLKPFAALKQRRRKVKAVEVLEPKVEAHL